ncbi:FAD:protein FMN transferase [Enterococcus sp. CSURQ0835]|uniref:FAD:protein FMN transferase n=1 Tax=Enterococcus sp. CSURQ0835 TaxID=2681394 RepID=UPI00135C0A2C|nr:FAD:protein FMN transferase [Enterococcus sp. CSURQ0835]
MTQGEKTVHLMGTVIRLWIEHAQPAEILLEAERRLIDYEKRFSANDESSELNQIKHNAGIKPVKVDPELFYLIAVGKKHSLAKDSLLNVAIGPLIQTWRIGFNDAKQPTETEIKALLKIIDPQKIELNEAEQTVFLTEKGMALDLGSLAKGYFADELLAYFKSVDVSAALIDLGGNILTYGPAPKHADHYWRIGIQNPFSKRGDYALVVKVKDQSLVTSGVYERAAEFNGKTYHHIFDSQTGYPLETAVTSLTVISPKSLDGEIWTTRLFGKSPEEIIATLNAYDLFGIVITNDGEIVYSEALGPQLTFNQ